MPEGARGPDAHAALSTAVSHMTGVLLSESTLDAVLDLVVFLAHRSIPDLRGVSVSLTRDGDLITAASSSKHAEVADRDQYRSGIGPCVEALRVGRPVESQDLLAERRWPEFTPVALEEGAYAVLTTPLQVQGRTLGALNIYSAKPRSFDEIRDLLQRFSEHAAVVLSNAYAYATAEQLNEQLKDALQSREVIGEAKGILMERERVSSQEAFEMLRRISQETNVKLRDVAQRLVASVERSAERSHGSEA